MTGQKDNKRNVGLDFIRGVCTLYVVGFFHLMNYTDAFPGYHNPITVRIACIAVGGFLFIAGYFFGLKERRSGQLSLADFYRKRFLRIFPLYASALLLFWFLGISEATESIKAFFLLSMFIKPAPTTLWFITMLMVFYAATPFFLSCIRKGRTAWLILASAIISVVVLILSANGGPVDSRLIVYLPGFIAGMIAGAGNKSVDKKLPLMSVLFLASIPVSFLPMPVEGWDFVAYAPMMLFGELVLFALAVRIRIRSRGLLALTHVVSYASYCLFLYHRPVYAVMRRLYFPAGGINQVLYLVLVCVPCAVIFSYLVQKIYDSLFERFRARTQMTQSPHKR